MADTQHADESDHLSSPTRRYIREKQIAAGGQALVYLGRDRESGDAVIIKQLSRERLADPQHVARFLRESEALRRLQHPNIVRLLDAYDEEDEHYIVIEYVPGGDLRRLLNGEPPPALAQILNIALELADALARAHHIGILHRDIKPENVLVTASGAPRLTDFGAALLVRSTSGDSRLTSSGAALGSPAYMSPEALYGEPLDQRSDIWSFGVMLFEMLAGRRPFEGDTATHLIVRILQDAPPDLATLRPDLPRPLNQLVNAMLVKDRTRRLGSMRLIASTLEDIIAGRQPQAPRPSQTVEHEHATPSPTATPPSIARHLPSAAIPFIGREQELRDLAAHLADPRLRLLTIMGPGGTGKTRLALQLARAAHHAFPDGVHFVPLAPLSNPHEILFAIAAALNLRFYNPDQALPQLFDHLRHRKLLLILDNFEHLLPAAAFIADLVAAAPHLTLLVTSRASLDLSFQRLYTLGGLAYPPPATRSQTQDARTITTYPAVRLLLQQAHLVRPDLIPSDAAEPDSGAAALHLSNLPAHYLQAAAEITRLVQGMPLAIVLAARWAELLPLPEIAAEIAGNLDFLDTTMQDLPPRQRSVRAAFDYSWQLLDPTLQHVFARLSVFRGGFTRSAAEKVTGATLHALLQLIRKSFVTPAHDGRYEVHELMRQFGQEHLHKSGDAQRIYEAHSHYYLSFLGRREADIKGRRQAAALREIDADMQNIRRAWRWAIDHQRRDDIDRALEALHLFCDMRGRHVEAIQLFARARDAFAAPPGAAPDPLWSRLHTRHAFLQVLVPGDPQQVEAQLRHALDVAAQIGDLYEIGIATQALGTFVSVVAQDSRLGAETSRRALDIFTGLDDAFFRVRALINLGLNTTTGDMVDVQHAATEPQDVATPGDRPHGPEAFSNYALQAIEIARAAGDIADVALGLANITEFAIGMGQYAQARDYCNEAIELARELDSAPIITYCQSWLAFLHLLEGDLDDAIAILQESLPLAEEIRSQTSEAYATALTALAFAIIGRHPDALTLARKSLDNPANNTLGLLFAPWAQAIAHYGLDNLPAAHLALRQALRQARDLAFPAPFLWLFPVAALLLDAESHHERADELFMLANNHPLAAPGWHDSWSALTALQKRGETAGEAKEAASAHPGAGDANFIKIISDLLE